jgi:hypothetical protein
VRFGHNEGFWQSVESVDEEVSSVIFGEANAVNVDDRFKV